MDQEKAADGRSCRYSGKVSGEFPQLFVLNPAHWNTEKTCKQDDSAKKWNEKEQIHIWGVDAVGKLLIAP